MRTINRSFYSALILSVIFAAGCSPAAKKTVKITPPEWSKNAIIYEVNIRQYTPEGTFKAFEKHLPRLKEMGIDILWLMPIHPIGEKNRKGTLGSYYSVKDYKGVNPNFGTHEDFRKLVDKIHEMGMYVIIDWVANHTAWDHEWVNSNPEFYTKDEAGKFVPPVEDWFDVVDLDYQNKELWNEMIDALKFWVDDYNIDGYRCDVAAMVPTEFWEEARTELDKVKPVFMLAEAHEPFLHSAFDMTYGWQLKDLMNEIAEGKKNAVDISTFVEEEKTEYPSHAYRMLFTTNHDENSWNGTVFERLGDNAEVFAVLFSTLDGMPLVYSGQEAGLDKRLDFFEKDLIEWKDHKFYKIFTKLFKLKNDNEALWNGNFGGEVMPIESGINESVFSFYRTKNDDTIIAVFNFSNQKQNVELKNSYINGTYISLFENDEKVFNGDDKLILEPFSYNVYFKK